VASVRGVVQSADELVALLDLELIEDDLFRGRQPNTRLQRVFGGQVLGQALAAAHRTSPPGRAVHSLHAYFLRPGDPAVPIIYDVQTLRDGRSFSARRVAARQHGNPIFYLSASFQVPEAGPEHRDVAPAAPPPDELPRLEFQDEWAALEVKDAGSSRPGGELHDPQHPALARVWMRTAGRLPDDAVIHQCALAYMSDLTLLGASMVPHAGQVLVQTASLDHAMWFHRPFRADDWLLYDQVSPSASGARGLSIGRIFSRDGALVATAVQEGLLRPHR
jgi:acyl-CoA thioesterase II